MKVLFIGGTGIISSAVTRLALQKGMDLYLLNRGNRQGMVPHGAKILQGDIRDENAVSKLLAKHDFDVVVNWVAFVPEHIQRDIRLFDGKTRQYIFISSASAYQKPQTHYRVTESTPLANPYWQYSRDKIACEEMLQNAYREKDFPVTIVRPSFTYGDTMIPAALNSWQNSWSIVERMKMGKQVVVHGDGTSLWTMTHNSDFAKGFTGLVGNPRTIGHAFHITSDEVLTWNQITAAIGDAAGVVPNILHISSDFIAAVCPELSGGLLGDKASSLIFDNAKIKEFVPDFAATLPFHEGIKRSIQWFEAQPDRCTSDPEWEQMVDRLIHAYHTGISAVK